MRVAVAVVVLGRVDAALGGDRVGATGESWNVKAFDVVAELGQGRCRGRAGEAGADDDDREPPLVVRVHQLHLELVVLPHRLDGGVGDLAVQDGHRIFSRSERGVGVGAEFS
jgi:hypothetical protein